MSALLSVRDLAAVALPTGRREGLFLMLRAYFDDSGTHADSEIVSIGGLIGNVQQWEKFERDWAARLADPLPGYGKPALKMFHLSHCNAKDGEFLGYTDGECDAVTHDFRQVLIAAGLASTASVIDKRAWNELVTGSLRDWIGDGINVCVENCLSEVIKIASPHPDGDAIAVVFDRGIWTQRLKDVTESYTYDLSRPRIISVTFSGVRETLPLQGADISATENYWQGIKILRNGTLRANNSETSTPREFNLEGAQGSSRSCPCSTHQTMPRQAPR